MAKRWVFLQLLIDTLSLMVTKMRTELVEIPTAEQREAVVAEVAQGLVRSASSLLDPGCIYGAWMDLEGGTVRNELVGRILTLLEDAGKLAVSKDHDKPRNKPDESTFASRNIREYYLLSVASRFRNSNPHNNS